MSTYRQLPSGTKVDYRYRTAVLSLTSVYPELSRRPTSAVLSNKNVKIIIVRVMLNRCRRGIPGLRLEIHEQTKHARRHYDRKYAFMPLVISGP